MKHWIRERQNNNLNWFQKHLPRLTNWGLEIVVAQSLGQNIATEEILSEGKTIQDGKYKRQLKSKDR